MLRYSADLLQRSNSVIAALLRLRSQYQRLGGGMQQQQQQHNNMNIGKTSTSPDQQQQQQQQSSSPSPTSTSTSTQSFRLSPSEVLAREALQLLNGEARGAEVLSSCPVASPDYGAEVGKLLSAAAAFGASTTAARVSEAMSWVVRNKKELRSPRQIMSVCMPLMNLKDGRTHGGVFVLTQLYEPLLAALRACNASSYYAESPLPPASAAAAVAADDAAAAGPVDHVRHTQLTRAAIISVFQLCSKLLDHVTCSHEENDAAPTVEKILILQEHAISSLVCCVQASSAYTAIAPMEVGECNQCLQSLQSMQALLATSPRRGQPSSDGGGEASANEASSNNAHVVREEDLASFTQRVDAIIDSLLPILHASLAFTEVTGSRRPMDYIHLIQTASQMRPHPSIEVLMAAAIKQLPATVASASMRDMCAVVQMVNRIRMATPQLIDPHTTIQPLLDTVRPKLFLLAETHPAQLRPIECSQLLSGLSRWEAAGVPLPDDVVELLCTVFTDKVRFAQSAQLIPFLQGLARLEANRSQHRGRAGRGNRSNNDKNLNGGGADGVLLRTIPCISSTLDVCSDRAQLLAREGKLSAADAANVLAALCHMQFLYGETYFLAVEDLLKSTLEMEAWPGEAEQSRRAACALTLQALEAFGRSERTDSDAWRRVAALRGLLVVDIVSGIEGIHTPKELVKVYTMLHTNAEAAGERGDDRANNSSMPDVSEEILQEEEEEEGDDNAAGALSSGAGERNVNSRDNALENIAVKVVDVAPQCNSYEVGALAMATAQMYAAGKITSSTTQHALDALTNRLLITGDNQLVLNLSEAKKVLDALRLGDYAGPTPPCLLASLQKSLSDMVSGGNRKRLALSSTVALGRTLVTSSRRGSNASSPLLYTTLHEYVRYCVSIVDRIDTATASVAAAASAMDGLTMLAHVLSQVVMAIPKPLPDSVDESIADDDECADTSSSNAAVLESALQDAFMAIGDCVFTLLEHRRERYMDLQRRETSGQVVVTTSDAPLLNPKQLVMLVRSLEVAGVAHHDLLYSLLPEVREMASVMGPMEVSLLMNSFTKLGVWNVRLMDHLAQQVMSRVAGCELRQCVSILRGMQRSGFLSDKAHLWPNTASDHTEDWHAADADQEPLSAKNPLESLARAAVQQLNSHVQTRERLYHVLETSTLADLVSAVHALDYFSSPPQPTFDSFYVLAVKKCIESSEKLRSSTAGEVDVAEVRHVLVTLMMLASRVQSLRRVDHQMTTSKALALACAKLEGSSLCSSGGGGDAQAWWSALPAVKLSEMVYTCAFHLFLYDVRLMPSCFAQPRAADATPVLLTAALQQITNHTSSSVVSTASLRSCRLALQQLVRLVVPIPLGQTITSDFLKRVLSTTDAMLSSMGEPLGASDRELRVALCSVLNQALACTVVEASNTAELLRNDLRARLRVLVSSCSPLRQQASEVRPMPYTELATLLHAAANSLHYQQQQQPPSSNAPSLLLSTSADDHLIKDFLMELSDALQASSRQGTVRGSVDALLGCALYFSCETDGTGCSDAADTAVLSVADAACRVLVPHTSKPDSTALRVLPELYRLLRSHDGVWVAWTMQMATDSGEADQQQQSNNEEDATSDEGADMMLALLVRCVNAFVRNAACEDAGTTAKMSAVRRGEIVSQLRASLADCVSTSTGAMGMEELIESVKWLENCK